MMIIITRVNGDRMDTHIIEHQKRVHENQNIDFGKVENNKHLNAEGEQHTVKNKLKEHLQIMWNNMRLQQISESGKLPKIKTNTKLMNFQEEINSAVLQTARCLKTEVQKERRKMKDSIMEKTKEDGTGRGCMDKCRVT